MSRGGEASRVTGGQAVVGTGIPRLGRDADVGGGGDGCDSHGDRLNRWEDIVAKKNLGMEPNAPLAYAYILELHYPSMSMLGGQGDWLERDTHQTHT